MILFGARGKDNKENGVLGNFPSLTIQTTLSTLQTRVALVDRDASYLTFRGHHIRELKIDSGCFSTVGLSFRCMSMLR